jgi:hypothetical protein
MVAVVSDSLIPISDEQAKAIQEVAKTTGSAFELVSKAGAYVGWVLGTVPADLVGVLGGDWLAQVRIRNLARYWERTKEILRDRGVTETVAVSPSIAIPLLQAAADESREELQELWARLLANAMDPKLNNVRYTFIAAVKAMNPTDALVLRYLHSNSISTVQRAAADNPQTVTIQQLAGAIEHRPDDTEVSLRDLSSVDFFDHANVGQRDWHMNATSREFMRACYPEVSASA